ncbi:hypothetical protein LINGRAPRIM_LOCUS232, partial [Linum grandiflorum]
LLPLNFFFFLHRSFLHHRSPTGGGAAASSHPLSLSRSRTVDGASPSRSVVNGGVAVRRISSLSRWPRGRRRRRPPPPLSPPRVMAIPRLLGLVLPRMLAPRTAGHGDVAAGWR